MSRSSFKGPLIGPYITYRIPVQVALAAAQPSTVLGQIPMAQDFRVCAVCFASLGHTANTTLAVTNNGGVAGTGAVDSDAAAAYRLRYGADFTALSSVLKGNALELRGTTDATGVIPLGSACAWVTGFHERHIAYGRFCESGQSARGGPVSGFYDLLTLTNLRQNANVAARTECDLLVPYPCKVMSVSFDMRGQTQTTGAITADIRKNDVSILSAALDADANPSITLDRLSTPSLLVDVGSPPAATSPRIFARGDKMSLYVASGLADVVPANALTAHVLVWVQGHTDVLQVGQLGGIAAGDLNAQFYRPGQLTGPCSGSMIAIPLLNKRAAQATNRSEDGILLPADLRLYYELHSKISANATTRGLANAGTAVGSPSTTQRYVSHNEGTTLPAPGSWPALVVGGSTAGEDAATRYFTSGAAMTLDCSIVAAAAGNIDATALCAVRSHHYVDTGTPGSHPND